MSGWPPPLVAEPEEGTDEWVAPPLIAEPDEAQDGGAARRLAARAEEAQDEWAAPPLVTELAGGLTDLCRTDPSPRMPPPAWPRAWVMCVLAWARKARAQPELAPIFTSAAPHIGDGAATTPRLVWIHAASLGLRRSRSNSDSQVPGRCPTGARAALP